MIVFGRGHARWSLRTVACVVALATALLALGCAAKGARVESRRGGGSTSESMMALERRAVVATDALSPAGLGDGRIYFTRADAAGDLTSHVRSAEDSASSALPVDVAWPHPVVGGYSFVRGGSAFVRHGTSTREVPAPFPVSSASASPDGAQVLVTSDAGEVALVQMATGVSRALEWCAEHGARGFSWHPNGSAVVFDAVADLGEGGLEGRRCIYRFSVDDFSSPVLVLTDAISPSYSNGGLLSAVSDEDQRVILVVDAGTGQVLGRQTAEDSVYATAWVDDTELVVEEAYSETSSRLIAYRAR